MDCCLAVCPSTKELPHYTTRAHGVWSVPSHLIGSLLADVMTGYIIKDVALRGGIGKGTSTWRSKVIPRSRRSATYVCLLAIRLGLNYTSGAIKQPGTNPFARRARSSIR